MIPEFSIFSGNICLFNEKQICVRFILLQNKNPKWKSFQVWWFHHFLPEVVQLKHRTDGDKLQLRLVLPLEINE